MEKKKAPCKVKITQCSLEQGWYKNRIGEIFETDLAPQGKDYVLWEDFCNGRLAYWRHISHEDCERIAIDENMASTPASPYHPATPFPSQQGGATAEECSHEPLIDTGNGYYFCSACKGSLTYKEFREGKPMQCAPLSSKPSADNRCEYEKCVEKFFGITIIKGVTPINTDDGILVNLLCYFDQHKNAIPKPSYTSESLREEFLKETEGSGDPFKASEGYIYWLERKLCTGSIPDPAMENSTHNLQSLGNKDEWLNDVRGAVAKQDQ